MADFSHYQELWTDEIIDLGGGTRDIKMRMLAVYTDGGKEWRYLGTTLAEKPVTDGTPVKELPAKRYPSVINELSASNDGMLYDLAIQAELELLNR